MYIILEIFFSFRKKIRIDLTTTKKHSPKSCATKIETGWCWGLMNTAINVVFLNHPQQSIILDGK